MLPVIFSQLLVFLWPQTTSILKHYFVSHGLEISYLQSSAICVGRDRLWKIVIQLIKKEKIVTNQSLCQQIVGGLLH